jgi:hypothetical protein
MLSIIAPNLMMKEVANSLDLILAQAIEPLTTLSTLEALYLTKPHNFAAIEALLLNVDVLGFEAADDFIDNCKEGHFVY